MPPCFFQESPVKLQEFYELAIQSGIDADPRGRPEVEQELREAQKAYEKLKPDEKAIFEAGRTKNPYAASRVLHGGPDRDVNNILAGIDIETPELLLADRLIQ